MANTIFQIKRSTSTAAPGSLQYGELAYSFNSGKLFIGDSANNAIDIGGNTYNQIINSATSSNIADALVKRDVSGVFAATAVVGNLYGNANTASKWETARLIGVSGDATGTVSVDGSANANVPLTLVDTGVVAATYGGDGQVPMITVDSKGRVTFAGNNSVGASSFTIAGNTGSDVFNTGGTLTFEGGDGLFTTITNDKVSINVNSTVVRTSGNQTIGGNLTVNGDLFVTGNTSTVDVSTLNVEDSLIRLANNNTTSDTIDIGFYGAANPGTLGYYGIARTVADSGNFFVFKNLPVDPTGNTITASSVTYANTGTLRASLTGGIVSGLNAAIGITDGGTGNNAIGSAGAVAYSDGTKYNFSAAGTTGQALISGGSGEPTFGTLDLRGGGIGLTAGGLLANSVIFYSGTGNSLSRTDSGTDGQVLQFSTSGGVSFGMLDGGSF